MSPCILTFDAKTPRWTSVVLPVSVYRPQVNCICEPAYMLCSSSKHSVLLSVPVPMDDFDDHVLENLFDAFHRVEVSLELLFDDSHPRWITEGFTDILQDA